MSGSTEGVRMDRRWLVDVWRVALTIGLPVLSLIVFTAVMRPQVADGGVAQEAVWAAELHANGELQVAVLVDGAWEEVGRLPYDQYPVERNVGLADLSVDGSIQVRIVYTGETAAHIDSVRLDGRPPVDVQGAGEGAALALEKLLARDHDLVDIRDRTLTLTFEADSAPAVLSVTARIEPERIPEAPFQFPPENTYQTIDRSCAFYTYSWNSQPGSLALDGELAGEGLEEPFFRELTKPSTGHPDGLAYGWVRNDEDHLYVALDFTSDNTSDGDKDYATVYVNVLGGVRSFRVSEAELEWGRPGFTYTQRAGYQHKVYELAIPLTELGLGSLEDGAEVELAFAMYGTAAPAQPFPGPLDPSFGGDGIVTTTVGSIAEANGVVVQPDGKIVVAGQAQSSFLVARYNSDGGLDLGFGTGGVVTTPIGSGYAQVNGIVLQSDGKIVAAGYATNGGDWDFAVARYDEYGNLDSGFGTGGVVTTSIGSSNDEAYAVALQADGRIVVAGYSNSGGDYDFTVMRYGSDGALDGGFGTGGVVTTHIGTDSDYGRGLTIQPNGRILVVGWSYQGSDRMLSLVRYTGAGVLDNGFGTSGVVTTSIGPDTKGYAVALQSGGRIVVAGQSQSPGGDDDFALLRYDSGGSLDTTFGNNGLVTTSFGTSDDRIQAVVVRPDDRIVAAGSNVGDRVAVAYYNANGTPVNGFGVGGKANVDVGSRGDAGDGMDLQADGRIVIAGDNGLESGTALAVVRYGRDLVIRKTVTPTSVLPGDAVTYTLAFSNTGAGVRNVGIVDPVPVSVTVSSVVSSGVPITTVSAGPTYVWEVGELEYEGWGVITLTGVVSDPLASCAFTNTATINLTRWDSDLRNNSSDARVVLYRIFLPLVLKN